LELLLKFPVLQERGDKMEFDSNKIDELVARADEIFESPEVEQMLSEFYALKAKMEEAEKLIKEKIMEDGIKSFDGPNVKISSQYYGAKYKVDESCIATIPKSLYKTKYLPDTRAIDAFVKDHHDLPQGVTPTIRKKNIRIALKKS